MHKERLCMVLRSLKVTIEAVEAELRKLLLREVVEDGDRCIMKCLGDAINLDELISVNPFFDDVDLWRLYWKYFCLNRKANDPELRGLATHIWMDFDTSWAESSADFVVDPKVNHQAWNPSNLTSAIGIRY